MSTPTEPNDADRALADRLVRSIGGQFTLNRNEFAGLIAAHRSSAVAEAVAGLEAELALANSDIVAIQVGTDMIRAERDSLKQAVALGEEISVKHAQFCEQLRAERDELSALVVRMREKVQAIETHSLIHSSPYIPPESKAYVERECREALSLVPESLADCVVVKRGEWERTPDLGKLMRDAHAQYVRPSTLWPKLIDGTPLNNDISVWMAEFARDAILDDRAALRPEAKGGAK